MTLKDLAKHHDYYCNMNNYYSNDCFNGFETWNDFFEEFGDADMDMNLVFRWDIGLYEDDEGDPVGDKFHMKVFIIGQRKGIFIPILISVVTEDDVPHIKKYLSKYWDKLNDLWAPISPDTDNFYGP